MDEIKDITIVEFMAHGVWAAAAGFFGFVLRRIEDNLPVDLKRGSIEVGAAAFVGLLVLMLCREFGMSANMTGVTVGVAAWMGATATIRILEKKLFGDKFLIKKKSDDPNG